MSKELASSINLDAPAPQVWEMLVDFDASPVEPLHPSAEGTAQVGGRLTSGSNQRVGDHAARRRSAGAGQPERQITPSVAYRAVAPGCGAAVVTWLASLT